jgi:glycosyltransferase involved in cell wall biosynthesis
MIRFSLIVPYHIDATGARDGMLKALLATIPARDDLEVLLVDDHSVQAFTPPSCPFRVEVLPNAPGQRYAGTARNVGMAHAQGTYLLFADSDDLYDTAALNSLLDAVAADGRDTVTVFYPTSFDDATGVEGTRHVYMHTNLDAFARTGNPQFYARIVSPVCKVIPRALVEAHGLVYSDHSHGNDVVFAAGLFVACPTPILHKDKIYKIRCHTESLMGTHSERSLLSRLDAIRKANVVFATNGHKDSRHLYDTWLIKLHRSRSKRWWAETRACMAQDPALFFGPKRMRRRLASLVMFAKKRALTIPFVRALHEK